ncbi:JNK-interacting protein 1 [Culicoides brevitarsis]|uniref:JNK-interacting protein 1 n=1 Tax=Culicoides brevitarsis TaxID=469753 RepID=UPI00307BBEA9
MADTEFEELRPVEALPKNIISVTPFYSLVADIDLDDDVLSPKSESPQDGTTKIPESKDTKTEGDESCHQPSKTQQILSNISNISSSSSAEDDDGLFSMSHTNNVNNNNEGDFDVDVRGSTQTQVIAPWNASVDANNVTSTGRRRRKLPEIPKNKKCSILPHFTKQPTLADEISRTMTSQIHQQSRTNSLLALKCSYLLDEDSSPDSDRLHSLGDVDSGHSTVHSPNDNYKSLSPPFPANSMTTSFGTIPFNQLEMLEATHRGLHKFVPRHADEIEIEIGDPVYVQTEADDLWCEGVNLRTGRQGVFPSAYAVDLEYNDFDSTAEQVKRERYLLGYLGSVETLSHKGTSVVCSAVRKIVDGGKGAPKVQPCILEINDQGLRMVDRSKKTDKGPCIDYFYSLKNVSFCAFHPKDHRYIGFITKHPSVQRFACHVFKGSDSTRPVAESVGRAFQRFYQKFIETAYPVEDIYLE